ncbi:unnamed protein product [Boreogadus saida]
MSRKKLAWANKEVETFVCILGEEDVVYDVYVAAAAIDIRPTTKVEKRHKGVSLWESLEEARGGHLPYCSYVSYFNHCQDFNPQTALPGLLCSAQ